MGVEDQISLRLQRGASAIALIDEGYSRATVYKIARRLSPPASAIPAAPWVVTLTPNPEAVRLLPGGVQVFQASIENTSSMPMLINLWGLSPTWEMASNRWISQERRLVVQPSRRVTLGTIMVPIPATAGLGQYDLWFGVHTQMFDPVTGQAVVGSVQWSEPWVLRVQKPLNGHKIFVSHSSLDLPWVRSIANNFDNLGFETIIAEDIADPGASLPQKFYSLIDQSSLVLAFLTPNSVRSQVVLDEISYAVETHKPLIPFKDECVQLSWSKEWEPFSLQESPDSVFHRVLDYAQDELGTLAGNIDWAKVLKYMRIPENLGHRFQ